ncbi:hypothetical protein A9507_15700 [Methanobacterium sp. A39]|uniref:Uncharacterized protein n=1 Tax=Methanobacterium bryantii TaxID=2161 RepID=A0A2A2H7X7_METBR|nr:hypothetical protein A9507_15700 [Methanobacterium sp. A39]PAV05497.1 hypothetical protein ASJ80_08975 [Methanobacterium bryantii]
MSFNLTFPSVNAEPSRNEELSSSIRVSTKNKKFFYNTLIADEVQKKQAMGLRNYTDGKEFFYQISDLKTIQLLKSIFNKNHLILKKCSLKRWVAILSDGNEQMIKINI